MENQQSSNSNFEGRGDHKFGGDQRFRSGRTFGGLVIVVVGTMLLAREVGVYFPGWLFSWPMWLIVLGFYIGVRHHFRNIGFLIPMAIGTVFLIDQMVPGIELREYLWPIMIIGVGLVMMLRSRTRADNDSLFRALDRGRIDPNKGDSGIFETVTIFGENKHQVLSKEFKGGESVCVFGGAEINLTQADIAGRVPLELVQVFGGTKLIVPAHWKIESEEVVTIFGGLNDKRQFNNTVTDPTKTLVLRGTSIFGGIDIKSF
ncbi:MAG: DUF5668 domain-containing protein [Chryseolinea sp.]